MVIYVKLFPDIVC